MLTDHLLKRFLAAGLYHAGADLAVTFQDRRNDGFAFRPSSRYFLFALGLVHVARLATDEGFIHFDLAGKFVTETAFVQGKPQAMIHEPCGFLGDVKIAGRVAGADAVLKITPQPKRRKPLVQAERGILENSASLEREAGHGVPGIALPHAILSEVGKLFGAAMGAFHNAIRPAQLHHDLAAILVFAKENHCALEGFDSV